MKIKIKKQIYWIFGGALSLVILLTVINPKAVFLMLFGYKYQSCGITTVSDGKNFSDNTPKQKVYIYKAGNKPFLLIGPYTFSPDCRDFFFVNKKQVIRTATDKGGEAFFQFLQAPHRCFHFHPRSSYTRKNPLFQKRHPRNPSRANDHKDD